MIEILHARLPTFDEPGRQFSASTSRQLSSNKSHSAVILRDTSLPVLSVDTRTGGGGWAAGVRRRGIRWWGEAEERANRQVDAVQGLLGRQVVVSTTMIYTLRPQREPGARQRPGGPDVLVTPLHSGATQCNKGTVAA